VTTISAFVQKEPADPIKHGKCSVLQKFWPYNLPAKPSFLTHIIFIFIIIFINSSRIINT
jgi:hypothetical protein